MDYFERSYRIVDSYRKALKVIRSCENCEQIEMTNSFLKIYFSSCDNYRKQKLEKIFNHKRESLNCDGSYKK